MDIYSNELMLQLCGESILQNCANVHKKLRDVLLHGNEETRYSVPKATRRSMQAYKIINTGRRERERERERKTNR
jgi:hypothetical protein